MPTLSKKRIFLFSITHMAVLFFLLLVSFTAGMDEFDGKREMTSFERVCGNAAEILMSPAYLFWNSWASRNVPDVVEQLLFLMNSLVWGTAIDALYAAVRQGGWRRVLHRR